MRSVNLSVVTLQYSRGNRLQKTSQCFSWNYCHSDQKWFVDLRKEQYLLSDNISSLWHVHFGVFRIKRVKHRESKNVWRMKAVCVHLVVT